MITHPLVQEAPYEISIQRLHRSTLGLLINISSLESNIASKHHQLSHTSPMTDEDQWWPLVFITWLSTLPWFTSEVSRVRRDPSLWSLIPRRGDRRHWQKYLCHRSIVLQVPRLNKARYLSLISQMALLAYYQQIRELFIVAPVIEMYRISVHPTVVHW